MRQVITAALAVSIAAAAGSACATKKFVTESFGEVDKKVESLGQSLEATQQRTKENAERITQVDQKADQVGTAAKAAQTSATAAQTSANAAGTKAADIDTLLKRLILEVEINYSDGKTLSSNIATKLTVPISSVELIHGTLFWDG